MCGVYLVNNKHFLPDRLYHTTDEMFNIMECRGCGLMRLDPRPPDAEMPNYYPDRYWAYGNTRQGFAGLYRRFVLRDHLRFIGKAIQSLEVPKARILDLGCGAGDILAVLRKRGHSAIGMDISHSALRSAAELNVPGTRGSYRQAPFAEGSFDIVLMFHVLEHIPDPDAAIAGARKLLRANGRLLIQVPNADCMQYTFLGKRWMGLDVPRHLYDYRRQDLENLLARNGFHVLRRKYFSWRDNAPCLATSLAPWLDPMARRVRRPKRAKVLRLVGDFMYFGLTMACWPFAIFESIFRRGATIMVDAEKLPQEAVTQWTGGGSPPLGQ
jgi:SAM-dependent methyltransferase